MEFVRTEPSVAKTKYRFTETFPDHKHVFSSSAGETIIATQPPTIDTLLDEIIQLEAKG
jgi:hypothetical protein